MDVFSYALGKKAGGGGTPATLIDKTITENGTYNASSDNADGYRRVIVDTPVMDKTEIEADHQEIEALNSLNEKYAYFLGSHEQYYDEDEQLYIYPMPEFLDYSNVGSYFEYGVFKGLDNSGGYFRMEDYFIDTTEVESFGEVFNEIALYRMPLVNTENATDLNGAFDTGMVYNYLTINDTDEIKQSIANILTMCANATQIYEEDKFLESAMGSLFETAMEYMDDVQQDYPTEYNNFINAGWDFYAS